MVSPRRSFKQLGRSDDSFRERSGAQKLKLDGAFHGKSIYKWLITGGTTTEEKTSIYGIIMGLSWIIYIYICINTYDYIYIYIYIYVKIMDDTETNASIIDYSGMIWDCNEN